MNLIEQVVARLEREGSAQDGTSDANLIGKPLPEPVTNDPQRLKVQKSKSFRAEPSVPLDDTVDDPENSVHDAGGALVVTTSRSVKLSLHAIGAQCYLDPTTQRTPVIDAFRRIKRPLLANAYGQGLPAVARGNRILVTSSVPGEGKTFTAIHLALSIASELDSSVILVDADIGHPSVHQAMGIVEQRGIADWFEYPRPAAHELVLNTNVEGLKLLPAGVWKPNSLEVLASRAIAGFFDELTAAFPKDIIVIDSPPVLAASETRALASLMGQIVFVIGAGSTGQHEVDQALEMLSGEPVVSLLLNRSKKNSAYGNYGY